MRPDGAKILAAATALATLLGDDWVGTIEINIYKGGVRSMEIRERIHPPDRRARGRPA